MVYHHANYGLHKSHVDARSTERWPVRLFQSLLPRLLRSSRNQRSIHCRGCDALAGATGAPGRLSIIQQGPELMVRMVHLAGMRFS